MASTVIFYRDVKKNLKKIPKHVQERFFHTVELLQDQPLLGIPLHGRFHGSRKYRIGDYRIVYRYDPKSKTLVILRIESRQGVYKN